MVAAKTSSFFTWGAYMGSIPDGTKDVQMEILINLYYSWHAERERLLKRLDDTTESLLYLLQRERDGI